MIKHIAPFTLFQQIVHWLDTSMGAPRQGRRYLEANPVLLQANAERELARLVRAHKEEAGETYQQLHTHLLLLHDALRKGGTTQAIRSSYVNIYGGLCLDPSPLLEKIDQQYSLLRKINRPERTSRAEIRLLRLALSQADIPELRAEVANELGMLLIQSTHYDTQQKRLQAIEEAIHLHEIAHSIFTLYSYPQQYARSMHLLGNAHYNHALAGDQEAFNRALACYDKALLIFTRTYAPGQWAQLQSNKGCIYTLQEPGSNRAIESHKAALSILQHEETSRLLRANIQVNQGDAYRRFAANCPGQDNRENLHQAMTCYRNALQIFTPANAARAWAEAHISLGMLYYTNAISLESEQYNTFIRCAIVCHESALQTYTQEAFPREYASTQASLGHLHHSLKSDDTKTNLEQAQTCYQLAANIFTDQAFPQEAQHIQQALREITAQIAVQ